MRTIRDRELFRTEYETWADFCREELQISVSQAERRIQCAGVASELIEADCVHLPFNENQCRPLMRLGAGFLRVYAWELACSIKQVGKAPTGNDVMRAVGLLESWRPPINDEKRPYFDFRKLLYGSRIPIKLAQQMSNSSSFQEWVNEQATSMESILLRNLVADLVARLNSLRVERSERRIGDGNSRTRKQRTQKISLRRKGKPETRSVTKARSKAKAERARQKGRDGGTGEG